MDRHKKRLLEPKISEPTRPVAITIERSKEDEEYFIKIIEERMNDENNQMDNRIHNGS